MPNRMNPIAKYLFALSAMIVAWTAYAKIAIPYLEGPPGVVARQQVNVDYPDINNTLDKSHLPVMVPSDGWELGKCKTLLTPQGTIYFEYWEPVDDEGTYKLMPFTIVMNDPVNSIRSETPTDKQSEKPSPIALRSLEGARLKFSKPLTARSKKDDVELESALLDGQVTLFRPANPVNEEDELRIVTRNIQINRKQIFTLADVHFSFGPHHGSGRNLSIQLTHKTDPETPGKNFSNIDGIDQMELAFVRDLVLQPANANVFSTSGSTSQTPLTLLSPNGKEGSGADSTGMLSLSNQKTPVRLSCEGPFVFRMAEKKAWFRDNVKVTQLDRYGDQLLCDSLQIEMAKESSETETSSIQNLIAVGSPDNPATITSRSQETLIVGEELIFDVPKSTVKAAGSNPVTIQSPTFAIEAPTLEYRLVKKGKLGDFTADGPGSLRGIKEVGDQPFEVKWNRGLSTKSIDAERVQINVSEKAFVKFDHQNSIAADHLSLVVWQLPEKKAIEKPESSEVSYQYTPSTLEAHGNVKLRTSELDGTTRDLFVNWPKPAPAIAAPVEPLLAPLQHTVSYRGTFARPAQWPDEIRAIPPQEPHMKFIGDKVVANVVGDLNKMKIRDLVVDGSLFVESTARNRRPFAFSGKSMKLVPQATDLYRVTIDGTESQMAKFRSEGFELEGANLQVDQQANTIWVHGAGTLNIDPKKGSYRTDNGEIPKLDSANVAWKGGMVFDGSKIYFEHLVDLVADRPATEEGQRSKIKASCEAMTLELTEPIRFEEIDAGKENAGAGKRPEIQRMIFINQVDQTKRAFQMASWQKNPNDTIGFQNTTLDARGNVIDAQQLFVPMATFDAKTGGIATTGPGQALSYQYSSAGKLSGIKPGNGRASQTSKKPELTCVHIRFDGQLNANTQKGVMEMDRNTRTAWANVKRFDQTLDPDRPADLPVGAAVLKADSLKFARWTPRNSPTRQEMQAEGNTSIRSELFEAVADRLTYSDDTDLLVIEGRPPADAKLSYRRSAKAQPETLRAAKVMYRISDQWTDVSDVRSVEAGLPRRK